MDENETVSVSKGVFVFKNNFKRSKKSLKKSLKSQCPNDMFSSNLWYQEYTSLWNTISEDIENLTDEIFSSMTSDLLNFVKTSHKNVVSEIPTAALLTGINMPDHEAQFKSLDKQIKSDISPHVAFLNSQHCGNVKYLMENMINQFVNDENDESSIEEDVMKTDQSKRHIKKSQLNLPLLKSWYEDIYTENTERNLLVVIIPDFESFSTEVMQTFILIADSYLESLPFVFIFGIATSITTLHTAFPYHVISKISIRIFKCEPSTVHLNKILESVFVNPFCPFQLGGRVFNLFTDIFLFYDFSVRNFVQNIKYAMMDHFCYGNAMALCNIDKKEVKDILLLFTHDDFENIRHLMSFRKLVESETYENRIKLLTDDTYFKKVVIDKVTNIQRYIRRLHIFLECLHALVADLPGFPLGKQLRELYAIAVSKNITKTPQYKECFQLLNFQSKDELCLKLEKITVILGKFLNESSKKTLLKDFYSEINKFRDILNDLDGFHMENEVEDEVMGCQENVLSNAMDRKALKEALLSRSKQKQKPLNKYEKLRKEILDFILKTVEIYLVEPSSFYFYEIFFFDDISIQNKIIGTHRTAIHNALNDPHYYLQCKCCEIPNSETIRSSMPAICIAYKLHRECGKMINLYDWLQAFLCVLDPNDDEDLDDKSKKIVDPELQAQFTQAVAELEYLGFIKSSKRKADHVTRLTWGG